MEVSRCQPKKPVSRREALSLLGVASCAVVLTGSTAQVGADQSQEIIWAVTLRRPQYIFGYGSLIDRHSRIATWASAQFAPPAIVKGIARGWFDQTEVPSWSPTYLGGFSDQGSESNGVIFRVSPGEFDSYTQRETGYRATQINPSHIAMLDGSSTVPDGDIGYFANTQKRFPSDVHPIVQSYVDVCLEGCLDIEDTYPLAKQANFAERLIRTTSNWGPPWINDRIHPWRPFVYVPRAWAIDALIRKVLGEEMFAQIKLK